MSNLTYVPTARQLAQADDMAPYPTKAYPYCLVANNHVLGWFRTQQGARVCAQLASITQFAVGRFEESHYQAVRSAA